MSFDLFTYITSVAFIYVYGRLAIHFVPGILHYFLNEPIHWHKQLEKPRIFFHIVGLFFMHLMTFSYTSLDNINNSLQLIYSIVFIPGLLLCHFSWTEKFRYSFLPQMKHSIGKSSENFNLSISESHLTELYNEMVRYELLDQDKTSLEDFRNVLLEDWTKHQSKLHLKMDGPSCREFYDYFTKTYPNNTLTLKNFFITSRLVLRSDGRRYNYNTLKNAPTRTPVSKNNETLVNIFKSLS